MADTRTLTFNITGRDTGAGRAFSAVGREAEVAGGHFSRLGSAMAGIGRGVATAGIVAGGAAVVGLGYAFKTGLGEVMDYQEGLSQLQAGLKSTHDVAGISAQGMEDLASSIQDYSGQTDDSIVKTEQLLLTFTNIRNEAGKGNDVFTQTTKIAADMAARMGTDASSAAIQLGKALNDPIKGITALTRVGVSFSAGQIASIKAMVDAGNTMGAQKLILGELNKEFGGSAKAFGQTLPGQIQIAKRSFEDFAQAAVTALLPAIRGTLTGLTSAFQAAAPYVASAMQSIGQGIGVAVDFIRTQALPVITQFVSVMAEKFQQVFPVVAAAVTQHLLPALQSVWGFVRSAILPLFESLAGFILGRLVPAFAKAAGPMLDGLRSAFQNISGAINSHRAQLAALGSTLEKIAGFILNKVAPVIGTYMKVQFQILGHSISAAITIISGIVEAFQAIWGAAKKVGEFFAGPFIRAIGNMVAAFLRAIGNMLDFFLKVSGGILHAAVLMMGWVPGIGGKLKSAERAFTGFRTSVVDEIGRAADAADAMGEKFHEIGYKAAHNFGLGFGSFDMYGAVYDSVHSAFQAADDGARHKIESKSPSRVAMRIGQDFVGGFVIGVKKHAQHIYNVAGMLAEGLVNGFGYRMQQLIGKFGGWVQYLISAVQDSFSSALDKIRSTMHDKIGKIRDGLTSSIADIRSGLRDAISTIDEGLSNRLDKINSRLSGTLEKIQATVDAAKEKLDGLIQARDQMVASITSSLSSLSFGSLFTQDETGATVMGNVGSFLSSKLAALQKLASDIAALRSAGLGGPLLQEIVSLPVDQATMVAEQILSGAAGSIADLNTAQSGIVSAAGGIGTDVGQASFAEDIAQQTLVLQRIETTAAEQKQQAIMDAERSRQQAREDARTAREQARADAHEAIEEARTHSQKQIEAVKAAAHAQVQAVMALVGALANLPRDANAKDIREALLKLKSQIGALGLA